MNYIIFASYLVYLGVIHIASNLFFQAIYLINV